MNIGKNLRKLRKILNLTQVEFSNKLRISKGFLSNLEKGVRHPSSQLLKLISYEFSASENWLLTGQGEMFIPPEEAFQNLYKTLTARHGELAVKKTIHNIMKEHALAIAAGRALPLADTGDPDLNSLIDTLYDLWTSGNTDMKGWIKIQFNRAFPKDVIEEAQKKTKGIPWASLRQLNLQLLLAQVI